MTYTVFVSHTGQDQQIAEDIKKIINDAFLGHIDLYLAAHQLRPGMNWKDEIKRRIKTYDAIISVVTSRSLTKPWIYIEWTAFWLSDKPCYILLTDDIQPTDLVSPMADLQTATMTNLEQVKLLFESLATDSKFARAIPFSHADIFVTNQWC